MKRLKILLLSQLLFIYSTSFAQNQDTLFYNSKAILMITQAIENKDSVIFLYDQSGKSILRQDHFTHTFFDEKFGKKRSIVIYKKVFMEDYCVSESDTVYNYIPFNQDFENRQQAFYNYLEKNVVYPKNALKKGIEANVKISLIINSNGSIYNLVPITKHEWGFEENLLFTIKEKKQFGYVLYKNKPIKYYLEIPFAFKIEKK
jgi:hypothetical protein